MWRFSTPCQGRATDLLATTFNSIDNDDDIMWWWYIRPCTKEHAMTADGVEVQLRLTLDNVIDAPATSFRLGMYRKLGGYHSRSECSAKKNHADISMQSAALSLYLNSEYFVRQILKFRTLLNIANQFCIWRKTGILSCSANFHIDIKPRLQVSCLIDVTDNCLEFMCLHPPSPSHTISPTCLLCGGGLIQSPCAVTGMLKWQYFKEPATNEQVVTRMIACCHLISALRAALTITFKEVRRQCRLINALP